MVLLVLSGKLCSVRLIQIVYQLGVLGFKGADLVSAGFVEIVNGGGVLTLHLSDLPFVLLQHSTYIERVLAISIRE